MDSNAFLQDPKFAGITPFEKKIWLSSPTMHGEELAFVKKAIETNWVSTVGENINELESMAAEYLNGHAYVYQAGGRAA